MANKATRIGSVETVIDNPLDGVPRPATTPKPEPSRPGYIVLGWWDLSMYQGTPIGLEHAMASHEEREALLHQMPLATVSYYEMPKEKADAMWEAEAKAWKRGRIRRGEPFKGENKPAD